MKVLIIHNKYRLRGGEETVVENQIEALELLGHDVRCYYKDSSKITTLGQKIAVGLSVIFNVRVAAEIRTILRSFKPDIVLIHNLVPLISPSVIWTCKKEGIPSILTLHNYRLICPSTSLFHNGRPYYRGINRQYLKVIFDAPYNHSIFGTICVLLSNWVHRRLHTWKIPASVIVLSDFQKRLFERYFEVNNFHHIPHFDSPAATSSFSEPKTLANQQTKESFFIYVGRLADDKGILELLDIWPNTLHLKIIGDGPLKQRVCSEASNRKNVEYLGQLNREELHPLYENASGTLVPSIWHEIFGMIIIESLSTGTPILCNEIEPLSSWISTQNIGACFDVRDQNSLLAAIANMEQNISTEHCQKVYLKNFSFKSGARKFESHLLEIISKETT